MDINENNAWYQLGLLFGENISIEKVEKKNIVRVS